MSRNLHSIEFRDQALLKVRERGKRSVQDIATDLQMSVGTLRKWIGKSNKGKGEVNARTVPLPDDVPAQSWGPAQRLQALGETYTMSQVQLHAWCREKGLFEHQLKAWSEAFGSAAAGAGRESMAALRELQVKHDGLQCELRRKEKALAAAAALLVPQKKFQALCWGARSDELSPTARKPAATD